MTTYGHGSKAGLIHGAYDLSPWTHTAKSTSKLDTADTSHFSNGVASSKTYIVGMNDGVFNFTGMYDGTNHNQTGNPADAVAWILNAAIVAEEAGGTPVAVVLAPTGFTPGAAIVGGFAKHTQYEISATIKDIVSFSGDIQLTGGTFAGEALGSLTPISTTTTGTAADDGALTLLGGLGTLHVVSNANTGTTTVKIQHSADNVTFTDLVTFTAVATNTVATQSQTVTGTVNRYLRMITTLSGTGPVSVTATFSRN